MVKYRIEVTNEMGEEWRLDIHDSNHTGSVTDLTGSARPFVLAAVDSDYTQYKALRTQELDVSFINEGDAFTIETFLTEDENQYTCRLYQEDALVFVGYLVQDGIQEAMVSYTNVFSLKFTDGVNRLKDLEFTNAQGLRPFGRRSIHHFIGNILHKLNPSINTYRVYCSLKEAADSTPDLFAKNLDWYTFEKDGGSNVDCLEALETICTAFSITCYQRGGAWWFVYFPDMVTKQMSWKQFTYTIDGGNVATVLESTGTDDYSASIGVDEFIIPVNEDQISRAVVGSKTTTVDYKHALPIDLPKNSRPAFGERNPDGDEGSTAQGYSIEHWDGVKGANLDQIISAPETIIGYWQKVRNSEGYESERRFRIRRDSVSGLAAIRSRPIEITTDEKMKISFSVRWNEDRSTPRTSAFILQVRLNGYNGITYYTTLKNGDEKQWQAESAIPVFEQKFLNADNGKPYNEWQQFNAIIDPPPTDGQVVIYLVNEVDWGNLVTNYTYFKNLSVKLEAREKSEREFVDAALAPVQIQGYSSVGSYINARFAARDRGRAAFRDYVRLRITGEQFKQTTDLPKKKPTTIQVGIGRAAKRIIKGCLFATDGVTLAGDNWVDNISSGRLGQIISRNFAYYTTRNYRTIEGSFKGLNYGSNGNTSLPRIIGFHNAVDFPNYSPFTGEKRYCIVAFTLDIQRALITLTLTETYDQASGSYNGGTLTFSSEFTYE
jgi:hypothetical protein